MPEPIVFDLDGTLVDSVADLHAAMAEVLRAEGAAALDLAEVRGFIGHGIPDLVARCAGAAGVAPERHGPMVEAMLRIYGANPATLTRPYPGVVAALDILATRGHKLGLCTNKALAPTLAILRATGLFSFFSTVIGGDSLPQRKPDPAPLHAAFAALGAPGLYVGDSEVDAETARRASLPFALYLEGYRKAPPEALAHDFAFVDWADLPVWVAARAV